MNRRPPVQTVELDDQPIAHLRTILLGSLDRQDGGFGGAPKFPHPTDLAFLLHRADDPDARDAALFTLRRMAQGGIHVRQQHLQRANRLRGHLGALGQGDVQTIVTTALVLDAMHQRHAHGEYRLLDHRT